MPARLLPLTPGKAAIPLERPVVLIGRHPECDFQIALPQISRRHCCIAQVADHFVVRDLGSANRVRINGHIVEEARLMPGDEIAIAHMIFRFDLTSQKARPTAPSPDVDLPSSVNDESDLVPLDDLT
jgi:pSer/pThr/pTyr-binding forkhead associated (FHA) protein